MFLGALCVNSLYGKVRSKILEKYGNKTDIDMDELKKSDNDQMRNIEISS